MTDDDVFLGESVDKMWCSGGRQVALVLTIVSLASKLSTWRKEHECQVLD